VLVKRVNAPSLIYTTLYRRAGQRLVPLKMAVNGLVEPTPDALIAAPTDLRSVDPYIGEEIARGRFCLGGKVLETRGKSPFAFDPPNAVFADRLHAFGWLRHVRATQSAKIYDVARRLVLDWIGRFGRKISSPVWTADLASQRLLAWLSHSPILLQDADSAFYGKFLKVVAKHVRYLRAIRPFVGDGESRLRVEVALAMASLSLPTDPKRISRYGARLDQELSRQISADGCHISRNPRLLIEILLDLLPLRHSYINLGYEAPAGLAQAIDRMFSAIRFFRHTDGNIALFNGATLPLSSEMASVLRYDETAGTALRELTDNGFHRLAAHETALIMDCGIAHSADLSSSASAGCLSFELSLGLNRFIVNSGYPLFGDATFKEVSRSTAAHSTLVLDDMSSARQAFGKWLGPNLAGGLSEVDVERSTGPDGEQIIKASHDGYLASLGYLHRRELSVSADGTEILGKDCVIPSTAKTRQTIKQTNAVVRFHIHPSIKIYNLDEHSVYLCAMDGTTLLFKSLDAPLFVSEDIHMGDVSGIRHSNQLEIAYRGTGPFDLRWMIQRTQ
jgi:uncharacterized heparinase superfamily protein